MTCSHVLSRAWRRLHVIASSSDWLIGLPASVVIGQSDAVEAVYNGHLRTDLSGRLVQRSVRWPLWERHQLEDFSE